MVGLRRVRGGEGLPADVLFVSLGSTQGLREVDDALAGALERAGARVVLVTRGDANDGSERWTLPAGAEVQRVVARVPAVGHAALWLASPTLRLVLATLGCALLAAAALRRIWSTP